MSEGSETVEIRGTVEEFLTEMEELGKKGLSCVLILDGRQIGAFVSIGDYEFLNQAAEREAEAEAKQASYYDNGEHRPEPWVSWSEQRKLLSEGGEGGPQDPARQS
jgi:hypothetical protein